MKLQAAGFTELFNVQLRKTNISLFSKYLKISLSNVRRNIIIITIYDYLADKTVHIYE